MEALKTTRTYRRKRTPPAVTYRVNFTPLSNKVDEFLPYFAAVFPASDQAVVKHWLEKFGNSLIRSIQSDLGRAATAGIDEAIATILDPAYYEHRLKSLRERSKTRAERREEKRKEETRRVLEGPTPEQAAMERRHIEDMLSYHRSGVEHYLVKLQTIDQPKLAAMEPAGRPA